MHSKKSTRRRKKMRARLGVLLGIPILLFVSGIIILSIAFYDQLSQAFYLSNIFIHDDYKFTAQYVDVDAEEETAKEIDQDLGLGKIWFPSLGDKFGNLIIESVGLNCPVFHGDRDVDLNRGVGHFNGSRFPGEGGNVVLSGHNNTVFAALEDVKLGDIVQFETTYGDYEYKVTDIRITNMNDLTIVEPSDYEKLTLYTCYPFMYLGRTPDRYVITCDLTSGTPLHQLIQKDEDLQ